MKNFFFLIMIAFFHPALGQELNPETSLPVVLYVYDPLCGWCYGFSPVMEDMAKVFNDKASFKVISGGMVTGDRVGPLSDIAPYIRKAYKDVEKLSGVSFGDKYLQILFGDAYWIMNSEPPSRIHALFCHEFPDQQTRVSALIQKGIYQEALPPVSDELSIWVGEQLGKSAEWTLQNMNSAENIQRVKDQYDLSAKLGVSGFPAVFVWKDGTWYQVSRGFTEKGQMNNTIQAVLRK